ncbi:MAG: 30S ribosomal protein S3, partial [Simkania sp.]|nr:30S ribosomal protein S3 [Simkania sp.]
KKLTGKDIWIEVAEIKRPDLDAKLVADAIAKQLERRVAFRRVMKKAIQASMDAGAAGIKIAVSGRIGGAEIARTEWYKEGRIPLHTLRANIDYATGRAETTYGSIGVKVWINKGDQNN